MSRYQRGLTCLYVLLAPVEALNLNTRRTVLSKLPARVGLTAAVLTSRRSPSSAAAEESEKPKFKRLPQTQFIAALGDPESSSGSGAEKWGLWEQDPGPRGVRLRGNGLGVDYAKLVGPDMKGVAPAGWRFDEKDWWLEEHGLIMEAPANLPARSLSSSEKSIRPFKRYVVTGAREITTVLTVHDDGRWELAKGKLYDVTHLPCRSARYQPPGGSGSCTPASASSSLFPVKPGAAMPDVPGCARQDYAVLFVVATEA